MPIGATRCKSASDSGAGQPLKQQLQLCGPVPADSQEMCSGTRPAGKPGQGGQNRNSPQKLQRHHCQQSRSNNRWLAFSAGTCPSTCRDEDELRAPLSRRHRTDGGTPVLVIGVVSAVPPAAMQSPPAQNSPAALVLRCSTTQRLGLASYAPAGQALTSDQPASRHRGSASSSNLPWGITGETVTTFSAKTSTILALDRSG